MTSTPADWAPLEGMAKAVPAVDPDEWMFMRLAVCGVHPPLWAYKHIESRRYLHLDQAGHAWDHIVVASVADQLVCVADPYPDVAAALAEHLEHST